MQSEPLIYPSPPPPLQSSSTLRHYRETSTLFFFSILQNPHHALIKNHLLSLHLLSPIKIPRISVVSSKTSILQFTARSNIFTTTANTGTLITIPEIPVPLLCPLSWILRHLGNLNHKKTSLSMPPFLRQSQSRKPLRLIVITIRNTSKGLLHLGINHQPFPPLFYQIFFLENSLTSRRFWVYSRVKRLGNQKCLSRGSKEFKSNKHSSLWIFQTRLSGIGILAFSFVRSAMFFPIHPRILIVTLTVSIIHHFQKDINATGSIFQTMTMLYKLILLICLSWVYFWWGWSWTWCPWNSLPFQGL